MSRNTFAMLQYVLVMLPATIPLQVASSTNLSFMEGSATGSLDDADVRLLTEASITVVSQPETPATRRWKNEKTGHYGELRTLSSFDGPNGIHCKRLRVVTHAETRTNKSTYTMCEMAADGWRLVPSSFAPQPKKSKSNDGGTTTNR